MSRLTPKEARALHKEGARPEEILDYNPVDHQEEMEDMMTGLAGLVLSTDLKSAASCEIGHRIPAFVIDTDVIRIFIAPEWIKVTPRRIIFEAFTYLGQWERFDTKRDAIVDRDAFLKELYALYSRAFADQSVPPEDPAGTNP